MINEEGVLVGCDAKQEWLLPWWWEHYSRHNSYPVAFMDFGMSPQGIEWCQKRGFYCVLPPLPEFSTDTISPETKILWEKMYGKQIWSVRQSWLKKTFAFLHTPFARTLWLDLDCRVENSIAPLLNTLLLGVEIALVQDPIDAQQADQKQGVLRQGEIGYNSGVIAFIKNAPILHHWVQLSLEEPELFLGDQQALCRAIHLHLPHYLELPAIYNWRWNFAPNPNAMITHFCGTGKTEILGQIEKRLQEKIEKNLQEDPCRLLLQQLVGGDVAAFAARFKEFIPLALDMFDMPGEEIEKMYRAFVLTMLSGLKEQYEIRTPAQNGKESYEVMLLPKKKEDLAFRMQFQKESSKDTPDEQPLRDYGIRPILHLHFVCKGQEVSIFSSLY